MTVARARYHKQTHSEPERVGGLALARGRVIAARVETVGETHQGGRL
jgi:hypothetical protein